MFRVVTFLLSGAPLGRPSIGVMEDSAENVMAIQTTIGTATRSVVGILYYTKNTTSTQNMFGTMIHFYNVSCIFTRITTPY